MATYFQDSDSRYKRGCHSRLVRFEVVHLYHSHRSCGIFGIQGSEENNQTGVTK